MSSPQSRFKIPPSIKKLDVNAQSEEYGKQRQVNHACIEKRHTIHDDEKQQPRHCILGQGATYTQRFASTSAASASPTNSIAADLFRASGAQANKHSRRSPHAVAQAYRTHGTSQSCANSLATCCCGSFPPAA